MKKKVRVIAYYLPQFHPVPENDEWWGKGFTEWTNVGRAKPLFRGHYQPRVPADLGYYDLRVAETREAQAEMARQYGVEGFCYWHYWFGNGKRLLERPFNEVLASGKPDFPFCLAWANETWKGFMHGLNNRNILIEQEYLGEKDYSDHFYAVLPAFKDSRYIKIEGKPVFVIYKPLASPEVAVLIKQWRKMAKENGLSGIYFIGHQNEFRIPDLKIFESGVDAINPVRLNNYIVNHKSLFLRWLGFIERKIHWKPVTETYSKVSKYFLIDEIDSKENVYPSITPGWDHTPRTGFEGYVMTHSTPELFKDHVKRAIDLIQHKEDEHKILFIKSWNEWAEGNYMEPDLKYGLKYLETLRDVLEM